MTDLIPDVLYQDAERRTWLIVGASRGNTPLNAPGLAVICCLLPTTLRSRVRHYPFSNAPA